MKNLLEISFEGATLSVIASPGHEWLIDTTTVAQAYGITEAGLRSHKLRHSNELILNKHFIEVDANSLSANGVADCNTPHNGSLKTFWTKKGVVRLGFFIKSEQAAKFRDFAEDLVINKTKPSIAPALPSFRDLAFMVIQSEDARIAAEEAQRLAELEAATQKALVQELAPAASYTKVVLTSVSTFRTTQIAVELNMSAIKLNQVLEAKKVQHKVNGEWCLNAKYQGNGYTESSTHVYKNSVSETCTSISTVWTEKGRLFIHELLNPNLNNYLKPLDN